MSKCPRCGQVFASEQSLEYHLTKRKIKCDQLICCNIYFKSNTKMKIHIISEHSIKKYDNTDLKK